MSQSTYILAHDLGTTGDKVTLIDAGDGKPATTAVMAYSTRYPRPNWAEQDAADWRRAVFEGTRQLLDLSGISPGLIADVYGLPILLPRLVAEATSLGAAVAGGVGVGLYPDFGIAREVVQVEQAEQPQAAHHGTYAALYELFERTYRALEPIFPDLAEILS